MLDPCLLGNCQQVSRFCNDIDCDDPELSQNMIVNRPVSFNTLNSVLRVGISLMTQMVATMRTAPFVRTPSKTALQLN